MRARGEESEDRARKTIHRLFTREVPCLICIIDMTGMSCVRELCVLRRVWMSMRGRKNVGGKQYGGLYAFSEPRINLVLQIPRIFFWRSSLLCKIAA